MVAKRFGEITNSLTGNGGSYLKVKEDETGFEFQKTEPIGDWVQSYGYYVGDLVIVSLQVYRCKTQHTSSSVFANDSANWDAVMIGPTGATGAPGATGPTGATGAAGADGISVFTWSTSEQTWPFEKDDAGRTLYCKVINTGALPNTGASFTNHNISSFDHSRVFKVYGKATNSAGGATMSLIPNFYMYYNIKATQIVIVTNADVSAYTSTTYMIYAK